MKKASSLLNILVALSMVLALFASGAIPAGAQTDQPRPPHPLPEGFEANFEEPIANFMRASEPSKPLDRIDPALRELAQKGGDQKVEVYVSVAPGVDLSKFLKQMIVRPEILKGQRNVYGITTADRLMDIAQETGVIAVVDSSGAMREKPFDPEQADKNPVDQAAAKAHLEQLRQNELTYKDAAAKTGGVGASGWFDVLDGHKSKAAWTKGFTGEGVIVGVLDDGVDFGHPDLQGTTAWVTDEESPYYGWPMAFSQVSLKYFTQEVLFQDLGAKGITEGWGGTRWSDTQTSFFVPTCFECTTGTVTYQPIGAPSAHTYTIPLSSASFTYKLGTFHELNLEAAYGERVAVLAVDEHAGGVYDTVYVDLDNDYDFSDEKPATQDSPEIYRDMDGDGYADISGGQLVWISDGENLPPGADWLWGVQCGDEVGTLKACPVSGDLLLFAGPFDAGYTHGTQCASNVAGQGVVNDGLTAQPFRMGGMVQGGAPDVGVMDFGNHYYSGTDEDEFIMAAVGYDGIPYSGDEIQITSNSYGSFTQMWGGWGYIGRLITTINLTIGENTVWLFSGGNEGPGWGPQEGEAGPTILKVGTSTQYGSTNWDSIAGIDQIVYGDPSSFGAHGPNRDGTSGLDVLANGGRGAGDEGINYYGFNGAESWATWGGTSRSSPVAAGNVALGFQAYKERYGDWPAWWEVLPAVKSSATNSVSDPFLQGGGVINADRLTDVAAGIYGVVATPDEWQVGDWEGEQYMNFANVAWPGTTYTQTYTVYNKSGYDITVDLSAKSMQRFDETLDFDFTTSSYEEESSFNFHSPDYLIDLNSVLGVDDIPADAELMVVRFVQPYDQFDPEEEFSGTPANSWRFLLYNWTDINKDGFLWTDKDNNGAVNHVDSPNVDNDGFHRVDFAAAGTEIQQGEYVRMDYEFGGIGVPIFVRDPLKRMQDGYFIGLQHRLNDGTIDRTDFKFRLEFYKRQPWSWLSLGTTTQLAVPAYDEATFEAVMQIPGDAAAGAYEGVILMNDPGNTWYEAHETALPVVANVINDLGYTGAVNVGAGPRTTALYQNSWTNGYFNWYGGGWTGAGDWRHFFFNVDEEYFDDEYKYFTNTYIAAKPNLLVHTFWDGDYPTDINSWVLGPTKDCASNGAGPCAWYASAIGQPWPEAFGPYTLQPIGNSSPFLAGAAYPFETSTGGPDDWLLVPLEQAGLHELALHNVLFSGNQIEEQLGADIGTLNLEATIDEKLGRVFRGTTEARVFTDTGSLDLWFTPSLAIPDLSATLAGGLATTPTGPMTVTVKNDNGGAGQGPNPYWDPNNTEEIFMVDTPGTTQLHIHVYMEASSDADVFLYYDVDDNGIREQGIDQRVASGTKSMGVDEDLVLSNPRLGRYFMVFNGYDMSNPAGTDISWAYWITAPGSLPSEASMVYSDTVAVYQDDPIDPKNSYSFTENFSSTLRTSAIHASMTGIAVTSDVDLYLLDMDSWEILAKSQEGPGGDELLDYLPADGEYRLGVEPHDYTLLVHGFYVPDEPITPTLQLWTDELNLWLDYPAANVSVNEIDADETVSITLMYDKTGFPLGDLLSARVIAGPSVLPGALSEMVNIKRVDGDLIPDVQATVTKTVTSERSSTFSIGIPAVTVVPGDIVNFTISIKNTGTEAGVLNPYDYWRNSRWDFVGWVSEPPPEWYNYTFASSACGDVCEALDIFVYLAPGESATYEYQAQKLTGGFTQNVVYANTLEAYLYFEGDYYYLGSYAQAAGIPLPFESFFFDDMTDRSQKYAPSSVAPGEDFSYDIYVHNPSSYDAPVYVEDFLPVGVEFDGWSSSIGCSTADSGFDPLTNKWWWSGYVSTDGCDLSLDANADPDLHEGEVLVNEASLSDKLEGEPFGWLGATTTIDEGVDLVLNKSVDKLVGFWGDFLSYEITLRNDGDFANSAYVEDPLPSYVNLWPNTLSTDMGTATYDANTRTIHWTGDLDNGDEVTITFQGRIASGTPAGRILLNPATAGAENWNWYVFSSAVTEQLVNLWYLPAVLNAAPPTP